MKINNLSFLLCNIFTMSMTTTISKELDDLDDLEELPRKLTSEEMKSRRLEARQRLIINYEKCERHITLLEHKIKEVQEWFETDKTSTKQKFHTLYQLEHQLSEKKKTYERLHKSIHV